MNRFCICTLLLLSISPAGYAQSPWTHFSDVPFGASKAETKEHIATRKNAVLINDTPGRLGYKNCLYDQYSGSTIYFTFSDEDRLYEGIVWIQDDQGDRDKDDRELNEILSAYWTKFGEACGEVYDHQETNRYIRAIWRSDADDIVSLSFEKDNINMDSGKVSVYFRNNKHKPDSDK